MGLTGADTKKTARKSGGHNSRELAMLVEMNREIHSTMYLNALLQILVEKALIGVNFERGLVYLVEDDYLRCVAFLDRIKKDKASLVVQKVGYDLEEKSVETLAVKLGKSIYIQNAVTDPRVSPKFRQFSDVREYCVVPLIGREKVLGVFTGDKYYSQDAILPEDIGTLELFAGHISLAIENAKFYEEKDSLNRLLEEKVNQRTAELEAANEKLSSKMTELSALASVSQLMNQSLKVDDIMERILPMIRGLGQNPCSIHTAGRDSQTTILSEDFKDSGLDPLAIELEAEFILKAGRAQKPFAVEGVRSVSSSMELAGFCDRNRLDSLLAVPMYGDKDRTAVLILYSHSADSFSRGRHVFFSAFANQAGVALERAYLFEEMVREKQCIEKKSAKLELENIYLKDRIKSDFEERFVIGRSQAMRNVIKAVRQVAGTEASVMIHGETGTGKELVAKAIHALSPRKDRALISINCAAIPESLLESELFGHEKGAFTGAHKKRVGMFELAHRGTIFLDEIGEISPNTQKKLLRVLQEQEVQPLGAKRPIKVDARVLAATNKDLKAEMDAGNFRPDLYYRLNVFPINVPALRERKEDLPLLVDFFLERYRPDLKGRLKLHPEAMAEFMNYPWPGNIRELKNVIERLTIIVNGDTITTDHLPREFGGTAGQAGTLIPLRDALARLKTDMVAEAMARTQGKKSAAAELLGLAPSNFSRLLKDLGLG